MHRYLILLPLLLLAATASATPVGRIVALVDTQIITSRDLEEEISQTIRDAERRAPVDEATRVAIRKGALDRIIDRKLVEQKIRELGIKVGDDEVRQSIEEVKKQNGLTQEALVTALTAQGLTYDAYKIQVKEQLERLRLVSQEVRSKIQVTEEESRAFYDANQAKFVTGEVLHARHIFIQLPTKSSAAETKKARATADKVLAEAKNGADFAELAKKYSNDPSGKNGGDLGDIKRGDLLPIIDEALNNLQPGMLSEVIVTSSGFHILKLESRAPGAPRPFAAAKAEIDELLYRQKSEQRFNQWLAELRKEAAIEILPEPAPLSTTVSAPPQAASPSTAPVGAKEGK
ncbi:MAG TPA: peptidylprolyl isomerase [Geobacterales bacterium]|nr:peptidylprolyl isomerase [Geobacterales bacterium]